MPKTRQTTFERDESGTFKKTCGAIVHEDTDGDSKTLFNLQRGKKVKRKTVDFLHEKGLLSKKARYICSSCVKNVAKDNDPENETVSATDSEELSQSKPYHCTSINDSEYQSCIEMGKYLSPYVESDVAHLYNTKDKCSLASLLGYDPAEWLHERPKALVGLLRELCGYDESITIDRQLKLVKIVELIYGCRNSKLILPLSFQENLMIYSLSRNKHLLTYNSKVALAGSTDSIFKWLSNEASTPVQFPTGMVRSVFDNEQVIGKTHKIKADNKVSSSVITSHLYICLDPESTMQNDERYAPTNWLFQKPDESQKTKFLTDDENATNIFRTTRNDFIAKRLQSVYNDNMNGNSDFIDASIARRSEVNNEKVCVDCGAENEASSRKCSNCGGQVVYESMNFSDLYAHKKDQKQYSFFSSVETEVHNFTVKTGEPDLCNHGSFENVAEILTNISQRSGISDGCNERKWLFLECDGGIYTLVEKLLFNVFYCTKCDESFYGSDNFLEHRCSILHNISQQYQFGWLLPLPGLLHIEMNACKAFFELSWDVMLKDFCMKLGFNSPKALDFAKSCGDHHKSWKILEIFYLAVADELLVPYVRHCIDLNAEASVDGYWNWATNIVDPNYMFIQQMVFTFLHSLMLYRTGCRRGNAEAITAGREKLSLLFFVRNHPRYQRIMTLNKYIESMMPDDLKETVKSSLTLSRTGNTGHYQGGDACLEEINKEAKQWISPKGVPLDNEWQKVFRNLDGLMQLRNKTVGMASGYMETVTYSQEQKVEYRELMPLKELLRSKEYLLHPMEERVHKSLSGEVNLCGELKTFTVESEGIRDQYFHDFLSEEDHSRKIIYITEEEKSEKMSVQNRTKAEIQKDILEILDQKSAKEAKFMEELFNKTVKGKGKKEYINFYNMLIDEVD